MSVFISWSGPRSKAFAQILRTWIETVVQAADPWMSDFDIEAGQRWNETVAVKLQSSNFGVLCVTPENASEPWLLFEAGALAKALDVSRVVPLLINMPKSDLRFPLAQFQAVEATKSGILSLVRSINQTLGPLAIRVETLAIAFERGWPALEEELKTVPHPAFSSTDLNQRPIVRVFDIPNESRDFTIMVQYFADAQSAHVCSGDYSWIKDNSDIQDKILELASTKRIILESYKNETEIRDNLGDDLAEKLRTSMRFQSRRRIKCSFIRHSGSEVFLYRSTRLEGPRKIDRICVVTDDGEGRSLIETLSKLISHRERSVAAIIMGLPASGKSTAAQYLNNLGYLVISAGDYFRDMCRLKGIQPSRDNCEAVGKEFLNRHGEEALGDRLLERVGHARRVVFDGIRPLRTATYLKHKFDETCLIYLEASEPQRILRAEEDPKNYKQLMEHPMEKQVLEVRAFADQVISNDGSLDDLRRQLREAVFSQLL